MTNSTPNAPASDDHWMGRALEEAKKGLGLTSPNPTVGAVVVKNGREVGGGFHEKAGAPHAEVRALAEAGPAAHGADLHVTLEPCSTRGRTPPCTEAILRSGIARVFIGCLDANPSHRGNGVRLLRDAGVDVVAGIRESECLNINEAFFHWVTTGAAFVTLKMAMTLDGKIATAGGDSQWITGAEARAEVQRLRRSADAVMVGGETVRSDNPSLLVRDPANWPRQPARFVWTRRGSNEFPPDTRLLTDEHSHATRLVHPSGEQQWRVFLRQLGEQQHTSLLVEGGGELAADLLRSNVVSKVIWFVAPRILGGAGSRPAVGGASPPTLDQCIQVRSVTVAFCGCDLMVKGYPVFQP